MVLSHEIKNLKKNKGFFLIEVIIASAMIAGVIIVLLSTIQNSVEVSQRSLERTQASYLLEEGAEAVKSIRDDSWSSITTLTNGVTPQTVGNFTRSFVLGAVYRDGNDDIASSGTLDTGTRMVTETVSWSTPNGTKSETLSFYIADIR
jgi:Tfp pilus assembly protein PilV